MRGIFFSKLGGYVKNKSIFTDVFLSFFVSLYQTSVFNMMTLLVYTFSIVFLRESGTNNNSVSNIKYEHSWK